MQKYLSKYFPRLPDRNAPQKINENGYVLVYAPFHPKSFGGGWYYLHRMIIECQVNRVLQSWETVHHISENKEDCSLRNLFACSRQEHDKVNKWPRRT
jgi:hypothetical protein